MDLRCLVIGITITPSKKNILRRVLYEEPSKDLENRDSELPNIILPRSARGLLRIRRSNWSDPLSQGALPVNSVAVNSVDFTCLHAVTNVI